MNGYQFHSQTLPNNSSTNSHNNYSDRTLSHLHHNNSLSTNSHNFITNFHNILWYSSSQYHARVSEDYSSHTFTTLSQTLHRIFQQVSTHLQHIFIMRQQIHQQVSTRWMSRFSFTAYSTNYDTFLHHIFNKQTFNKLFHNISSQHSSTNSFTTFFNKLFRNILRNILQQPLR